MKKDRDPVPAKDSGAVYSSRAFVFRRLSQEKATSRLSFPPAGQWSFSLPLSELYSLRRARFSLGRNFLVLTSRGGHPLPALHFHRGGTRELFRALQRYIVLDQ